MSCAWYNMPAYAGTISSQMPAVGYNQFGSGGNGGGMNLNYLTGLAAMLNRVYPGNIMGTSQQSRPQLVVRVEETNTVRPRRGGTQTVTVFPAGIGNRELDYYEYDPEYYDDPNGYVYGDDYSDSYGYSDTVTYYDMPSPDATRSLVRAPGNIFQTWYRSGLAGLPAASTANSDPCNACATSALLNFLMG
uniref:Uncharacterized protein n=1 Tax=Anopheles farauti TaxID=69004 RepID=A0A182QLM8_9DIPT